jgi:hypothetical protein
MPKKLLLGLALALAALGAIPVVAQAIVPRVFSNGRLLTTKHESAFAFGPITLTNAILPPLKCQNFSAGQTWNEVVNGTERGFLQTTGYGTWECLATGGPPPAVPGVKVKNARGETQEGIFATAEQPPESKTEKGHKAGATSLPWTGELTEKEAGKLFVLTHSVKVWIVIPLCTEEGGTGVGEGCLLAGDEIPFEDSTTVPGAELEPMSVNGVKNGLTPSKAVFEGPKTEKNGQVETGFLESGFGHGFTSGSLVAAGTGTFELLQDK